jgi:two-component system cell cycle sensor histidine kinase/response regulator CckA
MSANEELYRRIVKAVPEGIWVVSPEGRTIFCNERMAELLGTDVEALQRLSCFDPVFPDDLGEAQRQFRLQMAGGGQPFDFRLRRIDGSAIWVNISCMPMYDDGGVCTGLLGLFTDISERRRAERDLQDREELFRAIFSQAAVGIAQTSLTGEWLLVNDRLCQILGYTQAELRTKTHLEITHPGDRDGSLGAIRQLLSGEISSWLTEKRYIRKYGTIVWGRLFVSLVRDQSNQPQYFVAVVEEVTDRIQAERALQQSQQQLRLALSTGLGVWECDLRNNAVALSPQYRKAFGQPPLSYGEWMRLIHPDDRERVRAVAQESVEGARGWEGEFRVLWPDGSIHWMLSKAMVILDEDRHPERMVGVGLDITERKLAEAMLRESEERFRNMADTAPVMIWISDLDKRCTFFNKPWLDFTGRTIEQELGNGWLSGMHPEDLDRCRATYYSSFDAHRSFEMEYRLRCAGGEYRWLINHGTPLYREGDFVGFIGSCIDITEQKLIEERLRASEVQLTDAQRLAKVGSWERRIDTAISRWSDENRRILGVSNDAPANFSTFINCVHPKDREKVLEVDRQVRTNGGPGDVQYRILRPDGEVRFVHSVLEALRNDQGIAVRIVGATQDVTERVKAWELLRESEEHLKKAERLAQVGHWQLDLPANRVSGSEEMYRIFGKPKNYIPSYEGFLQDLVPQDRERVERLIRDSLAKKIGHSTEYQIAHSNGDLRTISCMWEVSLDEDGSPVRMFGTCQDITDSRRAQEEALARQKLESLGVLAGGIAHDFNNLLGGILAEAELAETDLAAGLAPTEEIQRIKLVAIRGAEIVRELMIFAGQDQTALAELVDVSRLVEEILQLLRISISKRAVLRTDLSPNLPAVRGNAAQIRQVVMNLVINASEAIGDKGGIINVSTAQVSDVNLASNSATGLSSGDCVRLEVSDDGCGMTETVQAKIFDPFFSTKFAGRGLGLAVVRGIVRTHGGEINSRSAPGEGTTFQVFLPCTPDRVAKVGGAVTSAGLERSHTRVATLLIVEDEETLRLAVSKALRRRGFSVIEASNGSEAMDVLGTRKDQIDGVLLDVTLPGTSSRDILYKIQEVRPDLKVIVTSAYSKETVDTFFTGLRIDHFIRKPFQLGDLTRLLGDVL